MDMAKPFIFVEHLFKYYDLTCALRDVTFSIEAGEIIALLGVNAAGKTTFSKVLATLHPPTKGDIQLHGRSIYKNISHYRRLLGYCPQKPNLNPSITIKDNLLFDGEYYGFSHKKNVERLDYLNEELGLEEFLSFYPDVLSEGWKQLYLIARTFMHHPSFVILDEATIGLDPEVRSRVLQFIQKQKEEAGVTFLLTTHYLDEAETLSDRVILLDSGEIKMVGTPQDLIDAFKKETLEQMFLKFAQEQKG